MIAVRRASPAWTSRAGQPQVDDVGMLLDSRAPSRATGLTFADLTVDDSTLISSSQGTITLTIAIAQLGAADVIFA